MRGSRCRAWWFMPVLAVLLSSTALAAPVSMAIKMDYFGYRPDDTKIAVLTADPGATVQVRTTADAVVYTVPTDGGSIAYIGAEGQPSGDAVWQVDFSPFTTAGTYRLYVPALGVQSYDFDLQSDVYTGAGEAAIKTYYYQRCGVAHPTPYAEGGWADPGVCHAYMTSVLPASGAPNYGALDLSGGWHDAGDYNKYVWGAVENAIVPMLTAFEDNPGLFYDGQLDIPESSNGVPDILDEVKFEIDWLLKMRMPDGVVLGRVFDNRAGAVDNNSCPPSEAIHDHYYYAPDPESRAVFNGCVAMFARVCAEHGDPYGNAAALKAIAIDTWENGTINDAETDMGYKVWAAAEVFRMDQTVTSAQNFVDTYDHPSTWFNTWADLWAVGQMAYTHAAFAYCQTPGATPSVVADMKMMIGGHSEWEYYSNRGMYGNALRADMYYWGSNGVRTSFGWGLTQAVKLNATGNLTAEQCTDLAEEFLHAMHGKNPKNMVYLTNMAAYGGEHASYQMYHQWFGVVKDPECVAWYIGLPPTVTEPDYPYFKGVDNYGVSDDNYSDYGPVPGLLVGGPNKDYSGRANPPSGETYYEKIYRDWTDDARRGWYNTKVWELTENSIGYQGFYVGLVAGFMNPALPPTIPDPPTNLTATTASCSAINLAWQDNSGNEDAFVIERKLGAGGTYDEIDTVGPNVTVYQDGGLTPETTYYYRVRARNEAGDSDPSNEAWATTDAAGESMHVSSIVVTLQPGGGPFRVVQADVVIVDGLGAPVQNATVYGTFTGVADGKVYEAAASAVTNESGLAVVVGPRLKNVASCTFCVDDVTHASLGYDPAANEETCDSA